MAAITFDTLKFFETLRASGFDEPQAKGMAFAIQEVQKNNLDEQATKADIRDIKRDLADVESRLESKIEKLELRMTIRLGALIVGSMGLLFTALRFFPPMY
ncbi:MAG: DUF1640 domain-containing protein [Magnetococcales bacterium]|nr:DUF1640 domain-containing protein [Magnetococcales bacterium]